MAKNPRKQTANGLARLLKIRCETKTVLAESLGMTLAQLRHIEAGRRRPTLPQAVALEDELQIPIRSWL